MNSILDKIEKYNCWDGQLFNAGYTRKDYLNQITKLIDNKLVKVLIGQRRVGKSYIMRQIINYLISEMHVEPKNIFYLNKEYMAFDEIKTSSDIENMFNTYTDY